MAILNGIVTVLLVITCGNLRRQSELTLHRLRLVLSKERLGAARNRTQAIGFARLKSMEGKLALATKVSAGVFIICALIVAMIG